MSWKKLKPIKPTIIGCLNCGGLVEKAEMDTEISVGLGLAYVTKDGETVYDERNCEKPWTVQDAENEAIKDPDHDWRITLYGGLSEKVFQRQGVREWVLIEEGMGFA